jgi:glycosyltransferase involved in cell wall biosynthesis
MNERLPAGRPLRVVFCWAEVSGYAAACWRSLAQRPGVELHVVHIDRLGAAPNPFGVSTLLAGISNTMLDTGAPNLGDVMLRAVTERDPDVVVLCGWVFWPYTRLVNAPQLRRARKLLGMDTPWRGTWLQRLARLRLAHFVDGLDLVVTAGERSAEYARRIGVPEHRLRSGYYGFDYGSFAAGATTRNGSWPRRFLYTGRYVPAKDLDTLVRGYQLYRHGVDDPWGLSCRGTGPESSLLKDVPGIVDDGFVQPAELPDVFASHGALVLPSRFEPWGVVIAEAAAAALPVICTSACGAAADIVRPYYNGVVVPPGDAAALARAMRWIHDHEGELPAIGRRGQPLAAAFSADAWAERWHNYIREACAA